MLSPRASHISGLAAVAILSPALAGCAFGPYTLERSHGRYQEAVRRVNEEQLLRNLVHIRYDEAPLHLSVSSIAAQYELAGQAEARPFFLAPNPAGSTFRNFTSVLPDASLSGSNRPTITFVPSDNGDAVERFLTPITADTLALLRQSSWPVEMVLRLWVDRLNGVPNASSAGVPDCGRFRRVAELLRAAQDLGLCVVRVEDRPVEVGGPQPAAAVTASASVEAAKNGMEYRPRVDGATWALTRKERRLVLEVNPAAIAHPVMEELAGLLNLVPGLGRYPIVIVPGMDPDPLLAPAPPSDVLRASLRSTSQVYSHLADGVEAPPEHLEAGLARPPAGPDGRSIADGLFVVHACRGHKPPPSAFVAVRYRDYWYYIDDRDPASKATLAMMLELSRLDFARQQPGGPFLTLPVGR